MMLSPVHVQKVPEASEHFCPAKLQTSCDVCCASQFEWLVKGSKSIAVSAAETCVRLCASQGIPSPTLFLCSMFVESVSDGMGDMCVTLEGQPQRSDLLYLHGQTRDGDCGRQCLRVVLPPLLTVKPPFI